MYMRGMKKRNMYTRRTLKSVLDIKQIKATTDSKVNVSNPSTRNSGYIRVGVNINKAGKMTGFSVAKTKHNRSMGSICLFIAGGKEIDKKVEKANAELRNK